ncbi:MAG: NAD(P)H-binding protein [Myxococcota bacterium]
MKITLFGATGGVGGELLRQSVDAGHEVTALVRTPSKLPADLRSRVQVVEGDALDPADVERALAGGTEAVLFALGASRKSPPNLCTEVTRHILAAMPKHGVDRFIWCGGGSAPMPDEQRNLGARIVTWTGEKFFGFLHHDKVHQLELLDDSRSIRWFGVRPIAIKKGPRTESYRMGYDDFGMFSSITYADCAHAMMSMLAGERWLHQAPIVRY